MINRELIRLKAVQLVYAYCKNETNSITTAEKEFSRSLAAAYELYKCQLALLVQVYRYAQRREDALKLRSERFRVTSSEATATNNLEARLAENKVLALLAADKTLVDYIEAGGNDWAEEAAFVKNLYKQFVGSEALVDYENKGDFSFEADRALVKKLYKTCVCQNDTLTDILEANNLYWNDDKDIVDSFILKTIKNLRPQNQCGQGEEAESILLPPYASREDKKFAEELFRNAITMREQTENLVRENCKNWDFSRLAFMDVVIAEVALTELLSFPTIPIDVTLSEYIEIARYYSTPQSPAYVNGLLDAIVRKLKAEKKIVKS